MSKAIVGEIPNSSPHSDLVTIPSTATLEEAQNILKKHKISSVPLINDKNEIVGVVNEVGIITRVVFEPLFNKYDSDEKAVGAEHKEVTELVKANAKVFSQPALESASLSLEGKQTWMFAYEDPVTKLLDALSQGVHRVLVTLPSVKKEGDEKSHGHLSQTDVTRFFLEHKDEAVVKSLAGTVETAASIPKKMLVVKHTTTALNAFRRMIINNETTAFPITDAEGRMVNTISATDFTSIHAENATDLLLPVEDFIKKVTGRDSKKHTGEKVLDRQPGIVSCQKGDSLKKVAEKMLTHKVHRVWVVDEKLAPVGVLSHTDILKQVYTHLDGSA